MDSVIGTIITAVISGVFALIAAYIASSFVHNRTMAEAKAKEAEAVETLAKAEALKNDIEEKQKVAEREAQDRIATYWQTYSKQLEERSKIQDSRILALEERERINAGDIERLNKALRASQSALRYLIGQVENDYPEAVKIATDIADMKQDAPVNGSRPDKPPDVTENHD